MSIKPIPDGFHTVNSYLIVKGAVKLIDFVQKAFDAIEVVRMNGPDNSIGHAAVNAKPSFTILLSRITYRTFEIQTRIQVISFIAHFQINTPIC